MYSLGERSSSSGYGFGWNCGNGFVVPYNETNQPQF